MSCLGNKFPANKFPQPSPLILMISINQNYTNQKRDDALGKFQLHRTADCLLSPALFSEKIGKAFSQFSLVAFS